MPPNSVGANGGVGTKRPVPGVHVTSSSAHTSRPRDSVCVTRPRAVRPSYTFVSDAEWCVPALMRAKRQRVALR